MADIMFAGIGGQGVLTAGKILIQIAAENGKNVSWTSEYSAEMRGGIALCRVVVSDEEIGSPYPDTLDVLVCMNEDATIHILARWRTVPRSLSISRCSAKGSILPMWRCSGWMPWAFPRNLTIPGAPTWL